MSNTFSCSLNRTSVLLLQMMYCGDHDGGACEIGLLYKQAPINGPLSSVLNLTGNMLSVMPARDRARSRGAGRASGEAQMCDCALLLMHLPSSAATPDECEARYEPHVLHRQQRLSQQRAPQANSTCINNARPIGSERRSHSHGVHMFS